MLSERKKRKRNRQNTKLGIFFRILLLTDPCFFICVLQSFQEHFIYIDPISKQSQPKQNSWAKLPDLPQAGHGFLIWARSEARTHCREKPMLKSQRSYLLDNGWLQCFSWLMMGTISFEHCFPKDAEKSVGWLLPYSSVNTVRFQSSRCGAECRVFLFKFCNLLFTA